PGLRRRDRRRDDDLGLAAGATVGGPRLGVQDGPAAGAGEVRHGESPARSGGSGIAIAARQPFYSRPGGLLKDAPNLRIAFRQSGPGGEAGRERADEVAVLRPVRHGEDDLLEG